MKTSNVLIALLQLLLVLLILAAPVVAQGPIDTSGATWLTEFIAAQRVSGYTAMIAQASNATPAQHSAWLEYVRPWCAVCGGDPSRGVSVWTGFAGGWSVAAFRYLPIAPSFWATSLGAYNYQRQYAPYGRDAYGNVRN